MSSKKKGKHNPVPVKKPDDDPVAIVGIGASAGGLEAFSTMLRELPIDTGMAFVFIQHLEPTHESRLSEIFSNLTRMPVKQIKETTHVKRNHVYVIPPGKYLSLKNGSLILSKREKTDGLYLPIDYFFSSLASEAKNKAIGIVLSGTASDGTQGLKAVKAEGGLTFAQDQLSAKYPGMPVSAIESGNVDIILPPEKIVRELVRIGTHPYIAFALPKDESDGVEEGDEYARIFRKLRVTTGVDFSNYKLNTIRRRISRRMVLNKTERLEDYVTLIKDSKTEAHELYRDLLINVTNFFRDPEVFEMLKQKVFPDVVSKIGADNPIRIWIPGCSTGEEVYSIAIALFDYLDSHEHRRHVQIFATDVSEAAIEKARQGLYSESAIKDVPPETKKKYFTNANGSFQIIKPIRDVCIFAKQDITKDPPFSKIDLISCRNLLIYFSAELQKKIIPVFHYALKPAGYLLLGTSESVGGFGDLFYLNERRFKLYHKKQTDARMDLNFTYTIPAEPAGNRLSYSDQVPNKLDIQKEADRIVLNRYTPPGILVNSAMEIVQFRGKVNKYLDPTSGDASLNVFRMLKENLNLDLHTAIRKVRQTAAPIIIDNINIDLDDSSKAIDLEVVPLKGNSDNKEFSYLILFRDNPETMKNKSNPDSKKKNSPKNESGSDVERLRRELLATKENLQAIIEEREATNEELRSALEELQSSNEELQSTNEEMETAREELQSTNEELITVNDELESRNEQLNIINNDLDNLLSSVNIPIIMLDRDMKIRRYTPRAEKVWNLIAGDLGRPIDNINPNIKVPDLIIDARFVLDNFETKEKVVKDGAGNWFYMKIRPYRTTDNKVDGVVISLFESEKQNIERIGDGRNLSKILFNESAGAVVVLDVDFDIVDGTSQFFQMFKLNTVNSSGKNIFEAGDGILNINELKLLLTDILSSKKDLNNHPLEIHLNQRTRHLVLNVKLIEFPFIEGKFLFLNFKE